MNMNQMMSQARKMQAKLAEVQNHLGDIEVSASAGGGAVKVTATADMEVTAISIAPDACDPDDVEMLEDMVLAAVNDALSAAQEAADRQMASVTGGMGIPGML